MFFYRQEAGGRRGGVMVGGLSQEGPIGSWSIINILKVIKNLTLYFEEVGKEE